MDKILAHLDAKTWTLIAIISVTGLLFHIRWSRQATTLGPTLLTTLGILFCFVGIALGLLDFDPNDVKASVPALLNGIRMSFWASVAGISWAVTIKVRRLLAGEPAYASSEGASGATVDDLAEGLRRLNAAIAGEEDSTLLSQLKLIRSDGNDRLDRLQKSFERFAQTMAEANSKALIAALSEVIRDFNQKLTEQFGENFKQLNAAVEMLVIWQVQYKEQLSDLIQQESITRKSMTEASLRYAELVNKSGVFSSVAESLGQLLSALNQQRDQLESSLRSLGELIVKASTGLPDIERKIVEMTQQIEAGVRGHQDVLGATLKTTAQSIQANNQQLTSVLSTTIANANKELNSHIKQAAEDTKKSVVALDKALEAELTKALESLGQQLAALSQKFVADYTPLTAQLQRVVQMAGRA